MGAGLAGVTAAWYLAQAGDDVIVLERNASVAEETSFQNGGLISAGHCHAWAAPGVVWKLIKSMLQKDPPMRLRLQNDLAFWRWSLLFLSNCTRSDYHANTQRVFRCMSQGATEMRALCEATGIDHLGGDNGILYLFRSEESFESRRGEWDILRDHGFPLHYASAEECVDIEPALARANAPIGGGIFSPEEGCGDARVFSTSLADKCAAAGVRFECGADIQQLMVTGGRVCGIVTSKGEFTAERYLLALGPESAAVGRSAGLRLPIIPAKGYSIDIPLADDQAAPKVNVIDEDNYVAMARLGGALRLAGKVEFTGYDRSYHDGNFTGLLQVARELFPGVGDFDDANYWACLRPVTPGGPPLLGATPIENLFLNTGLGGVGWTVCCATSKTAVDIMHGRKPALDLDGLTLRDHLR